MVLVVIFLEIEMDLHKTSFFYHLNLRKKTDGAAFFLFYKLTLSIVYFRKWDENQPQNFAAYDEDCAATSATGLWHDYKCSHTFTFVCKKMAEFRIQG